MISGSSALAMMIASEPARPSRHFSASIRVSAARSSWSRERFSSAMALGATSLATPARYFSSTSITPKRASEPPASAEVMPAGMLAPSALETTGPLARSASASSRVVVVLPLVADTSTTSRCRASLASRSGSNLQRDLAADHRPAALARRARHRRRGPARRHGQLRPWRQRLRVACHRLSSSSTPAAMPPAAAGFPSPGRPLRRPTSSGRGSAYRLRAAEPHRAAGCGAGGHSPGLPARSPASASRPQSRSARWRTSWSREQRPFAEPPVARRVHHPDDAVPPDPGHFAGCPGRGRAARLSPRPGPRPSGAAAGRSAGRRRSPSRPRRVSAGCIRKR